MIEKGIPIPLTRGEEDEKSLSIRDLFRNGEIGDSILLDIGSIENLASRVRRVTGHGIKEWAVGRTTNQGIRLWKAKEIS